MKITKATAKRIGNQLEIDRLKILSGAKDDGLSRNTKK